MSHPGVQKMLAPELWIRKAWHIGASFILTLCYIILPFGIFYPWFVAATLLWIVLEFIRLTPWAQGLPLHDLMRTYILKDKEHDKFTAGLQTMLAILVVTFCMQRSIATLALLYLTFGDPIANVAGVAFQGPKFHRNKSLHGTFALCIFAFILTFVVLLFTSMSPLIALFMAIIGSLSAGIFEAYNLGLDDNASLTLGPAITLQVAYYFLSTT